MSSYIVGVNTCTVGIEMDYMPQQGLEHAQYISHIL
jgi:fructose-specific phosphotransferase system component IIB